MEDCNRSRFGVVTAPATEFPVFRIASRSAGCIPDWVVQLTACADDVAEASAPATRKLVRIRNETFRAVCVWMFHFGAGCITASPVRRGCLARFNLNVRLQ